MPPGSLAEILAADALLVPWPNGGMMMHDGPRPSSLATFRSIGKVPIVGWILSHGDRVRELGLLPGTGTPVVMMVELNQLRCIDGEREKRRSTCRGSRSTGTCNTLLLSWIHTFGRHHHLALLFTQYFRQGRAATAFSIIKHSYHCSISPLTSVNRGAN